MLDGETAYRMGLALALAALIGTLLLCALTGCCDGPAPRRAPHSIHTADHLQDDGG